MAYGTVYSEGIMKFWRLGNGGGEDNAVRSKDNRLFDNDKRYDSVIAKLDSSFNKRDKAFDRLEKLIWGLYLLIFITTFTGVWL